MYTHLVMPDGKLVLVPNQELAAQRITNHYKRPLRRMDVTVRVGGDAQQPALEPEKITPETVGTLAQRLYPLLDEDTIAAIRKGL